MELKKLKKTILSTSLALLIGASALIPSGVFAEPGGGGKSLLGDDDKYYPVVNAPYKFQLANYGKKYANEEDYNKDENKLKGAKYKINEVGKMLKTGEIEKNAEPKKIFEGSIDGVNSKEITVPGRYELIQVERPHGYLLGQGKDEHGKALEKVTVDFPVINENGQIASADKQFYKVAPKFEKVEKEFNLKKLGDDGKALKDVEFKLSALFFAEEGALKKYYTEHGNSNVIATGTSGEDGTVTWNTAGLKLVEGKYLLEETKVPEGYAKRNFIVTLGAKAGKELTATSKEDFEFKIERANGKTVNGLDLGKENGGLVELNNYNAPTPKENGKDKGTAEVSKEIANIGTKTEVCDNLTFAKKINLRTTENAQYKISFGIPKDILAYKAFSLTEEIPEGLKLVDNSKIRVTGTDSNNSDLTNVDWIKVENKGKTITIKVMENGEGTGVVAGAKINVEFIVSVDRSKVNHGGEILNNVTTDYDPGEKTPNFKCDGNGACGTENPLDPSKTKDVEKPSPQSIPKNDQPKAVITKTTTTVRAQDAESKTGLPGVSYKVQVKDGDSWVDAKNENGEVITVTTKDNGEVEIIDLPNGDYKIINTNIPTGYHKKGLPQEFKIKQDTPDNKIIFNYDKNDEKVGILPSTGTLGMVPFALAGMALVGAFISLNKKKEEKNVQ